MMGDDQLRMKRQCLLDGLLRDIQHDEHTAHLAFRKAAEQPNIIKIQFERGWYTLFQIPAISRTVAMAFPPHFRNVRRGKAQRVQPLTVALPSGAFQTANGDIEPFVLFREYIGEQRVVRDQ